MKQKITSVAELGAIVRAARKGSTPALRLDEFAQMVGLSKQFVNDVELGKDTVQLGKVFEILSQLGVHVYLDIPPGTEARLEHSKMQIDRTNGRRNSSDSLTPMTGSWKKIYGNARSTQSGPSKSIVLKPKVVTERTMLDIFARIREANNNKKN